MHYTDGFWDSYCYAPLKKRKSFFARSALCVTKELLRKAETLFESQRSSPEALFEFEIEDLFE